MSEQPGSLVPDPCLIGPEDPILVTGANGFIGARVVNALLESGFAAVRCFVRPGADTNRLDEILGRFPSQRVGMVRGNLLSPDDTARAVEGVRVICHLAAGIDKSFASAFMNSVVTTRNLVDAALADGHLLRFVNVSSFAVYSGMGLRAGAVLDESAERETPPDARREAYGYAKIKQEDLILDYGRTDGLPYVILRPGAVYGPGRSSLSGRVGIDTFGVYLHLGGSIRLPLTYVDNCADAIVLAGLVPGVDGEVFNVVDDDPPTSRAFLRLYKENVRRFVSLPVPYSVSYALSALWEKYSDWSEGQLPPAFNRRRAAAEWKGHAYPNRKLRERLGWTPRVGFEAGAERFFDYARASAS